MSLSARSSHLAELMPETVHGLRTALLRHYDRHARRLPWRGESDPYRILVSEVMLQQTRVETVLPYYRGWLTRFPDVESLAAADEDEVLKRWEGLGYYRRARNLHSAASVVREKHGGELPGSYDELRALPGVGEYTAGAVASIAFGEVVPAVDGNVRRVMARIMDVEDPTPRWLRDVAGRLVDPDRPGDWNQALMDLGATVCTPRNPSCDTCPLDFFCRSRAAGTQGERPRAKAPNKVRVAAFATAVVVDAGRRALVERRPAGGLLGGLWSFPDAPLSDGAGVAERALTRAEEAGVAVDSAVDGVPLPDVVHKFSHIHATYRPVLFRGEGAAGEHRRWIDLEGDDGVALPVAQKKIARAAAAALATACPVGPQAP